MEKRRSLRSSPGILPQSPLLYEKYKSGCAWRLINFFDFRQGRSGKRLVSDKSHGYRDSAGNVYTKSQLHLLRKLHEKCQCTNNANANAEKIVEEEISSRPRTKRRSSVSGTEHERSYPKPVLESPNREIRRNKHVKEETFDSLIQAQGKIVFSEQKQSSLTEIEKSGKANDIRLGLRKSRDQSCKNVEPNLEKHQEINFHVRVNEAAEALICQKAKKGKAFGRDMRSDQSKQFLEALDVLSSNKELFVTLLQDPNSFSAKCVQEAKSSSKAESFETRLSGESDGLDRIVLLKPRLNSSSEDSAYLRFKHLAKKLKLVVGSNRETESARRTSDATKSDERDSQCRFDASTSTIGHRSQESLVFKRKKRVDSDVFKLNVETDVSPRRLMVERQHERTSSLPVYEVPHTLREHDACVSPDTRFKERNQRLGSEKQRYRIQSTGKNVEVLNSKNGSHLGSYGCRGSAAHSNLRPNMEDEIVKQRYSQSSSAESCKDNHSRILETNALFSDCSSPERPNSNVIDLKQEQEHPSPVSVLARIHMEDDTVTSPEERNVLLSSDPSIVELKSILERGSVQEFVKIVLETCGLTRTKLLLKCTVSSPESSLLDQFSHTNNNDHHHQRFVLDYTNEILRETYREDIKSWPFIPLKNPRLDLVHQAMKRFDWSLLCDSGGPPRTLDQLVEKDLAKTCMWMDFGGETEGIVADVVEQVLGQLEMEIAKELGTMPTRISKFLRAYSTFL